MIKQKPCKGQNKALGFQSCGKLTNVERLKYGLCSSCYPNFLLTDERGKIIMQKAMSFGKQKVIKEKKSIESEKTKKMRENVKTLSQYEAEAKRSFQKWIRLRDAGKNCISCDKPNDLMDGGHFKKAEIYSGVIFHEMNAHSQCRKCNRYLNGNELNYRLGLIKRYGEEYANFIEDLANSTRIKKYTKQELIDIKKKYDLLIKFIKNEQ